MAAGANPVVVFFAFANEREQGADYLRNLPEELRRLRGAMEGAVEAGLCELVERANTTVDDIFDVLQDPENRDRVAIFHYGGHAGSKELILETPGGAARVAHAGGLAAFLGEQRGLELVFLNGCSSRGQVRGLLDAGVPVVIATSQAIDDWVARQFSFRFYKSLASGAPIRTAFREAEAAVRTTTGETASSTYRSSVPELLGEDRWPWEIHVAAGAEDHADKWSLPQAANDPLYGLPVPPVRDLPASPYKHLHWFTRDDAEIFFGRGREIRDLYEAITRPHGAPIVLFFGATGVGKSSVLDAGLRPRLEGSHEVLYLRRDRSQGLAETLAGIGDLGTGDPGLMKTDSLCRLVGELMDTGPLPVHPADADPPPYPLSAAWREHEAATGRPLVVILDQVEEVYTRPNLERPREMEELAAALRRLFVTRDKRPRGKLILGFRKEWLAEILRILDAEKLPRTRMEIRNLESEGIMEAVAGPASSERLRRCYGLQVEPELPAVIADDLAPDRTAAIAPALQILLSKMWRLANRESPDAPRFTVGLYRRLKRRGILLDNFLEEQLSDLGEWRQELVTSGLALDLLAHHTTSLGTAETHRADRVVARYGGRPEIAELLQQCKDRYLLTGTARVQEGELVGDSAEPDDKGTTRLTHDTLAPVVRRRFEGSNLPGQRALRILEQRAFGWAGEHEGTPLDEADLAQVEAGKAGMRRWTPAEERLVAASRRRRQARRKRQRNRQRVAWMVAGTMVVLAVVAAGAAYLADRQRARAEREAQTARQTAEFLVDLFAVSDPGEARGDTITAREVLDRGAERLERELAGQPAVRARLMDTIGEVYMGLGLYDDAAPLLESALASRRQLYGDQHPEVAESLNDLGLLLQAQGDFDAAEPLIRQALTMRRELDGSEHREVAGILNDLATLLRLKGDYEAAEPLYREALAMRRRLLGAEHSEVAETLDELAGLLYYTGNYEAAEPLYRQALAILREALGEDHPKVAMSLHDLAVLLSSKGDYEAAEQIHREGLEIKRKLFGAEHPDIAMSLDSLAFVLRMQGDYESSEVLYRETLAMSRKLLGDEHPRVATSVNNLAAMLRAKGDIEAAEPLFRQSLAMYRRLLGEKHTHVAASLTNLAWLLVAKGEYEDATQLIGEALEIFRQTLPAGHWWTANAESVRGACLVGLGRYLEAEPLLLGAYPILKQKTGERSKHTRDGLRRIVELYEAWDKPEKAAEYRTLWAQSGTSAQ